MAQLLLSKFETKTEGLVKSLEHWNYLSTGTVFVITTTGMFDVGYF